MQNTSSLYKDLIRQSGRMFKAKIAVTYADSSTAALTDENIMQDSFVITTGTSDEGSFSIGNAVIGQLDFEIDNSSGDYDNLSFDDAVFDTRVALIVRQSYDGTLTPEWIRKGIFTAEEVTVDENYIKITAYDNMSKLDKPFSKSGISFPVSLASLFRQICTSCGVAYGGSDFPNSSLTINSAAEIDESTSCRDMISYIAQLACCFVYADVNGTIQMGWYRDTNYTVTEQQKLNGTVTITGVQLTDTEDTAHLSGTKNYCLMIDDNPIALNGSALQNVVWSDRLIGMELTPFSAEIMSDPSIEAGDIVTVSDLHGNTYSTPITNMIYRLDGKMTVSCDAETVKEKQRSSCSPSARIIAQTNRKMNKKISEYDIRAKQFSQLMSNAMGFHQTDVTQQDGSTISYLHDKELLSDSQIIWKKSINGFAVSRDGGQTYVNGFDSDGNAVFNVLAAVGIVADWINAGTISGLEIIAAIGKIAGWTMQNDMLVSNDGTIKFDSRNNTIRIYDTNRILQFSINQSGIHMYRDDKYIGMIGTSHLAGTNDYGLVFHLADEGDFMSWSVENTTTGVYQQKLVYSRTSGFTIDGDIVITGNVGIRGDITDGNISTGISTDGYAPVTGEFWAIKSLQKDSDGHITSMQAGTVKVRNGLITAW